MRALARTLPCDPHICFAFPDLVAVVAFINASDSVVGTQGYYPFVGTRYTSGTLFTDRLYTGQQQIAGLGLYNYKARYYDPALGRFTSPDTVTPGGTERLNRYSYGLNNPVKYSDPTGHKACDELGENGKCIVNPAGIDSVVTFFGEWDPVKKNDAIKAIKTAGNKFRDGGESAYDAFVRIFGTMSFVWGNNDKQDDVPLHGWCDRNSESCHGGWSEPSTPGVVAFYTSSGYTGDQFSALVTHELGHKFLYEYGYGTLSGGFNDLRNKVLNGPEVMNSDGIPVASTWRHASSDGWDETAPDFFTAWVFNEWNPNPKNANDVADAIIAINAMMSDFR